MCAPSLLLSLDVNRYLPIDGTVLCAMGNWFSSISKRTEMQTSNAPPKMKRKKMSTKWHCTRIFSLQYLGHDFLAPHLVTWAQHWTLTQREFSRVVRRQEEQYRGEQGEHDGRAHEHVLVVRTPALQAEGVRHVRVRLLTARVVLIVFLCRILREFPDVTLNVVRKVYPIQAIVVANVQLKITVDLDDGRNVLRKVLHHNVSTNLFYAIFVHQEVIRWGCWELVLVWSCINDTRKWFHVPWPFCQFVDPVFDC